MRYPLNSVIVTQEFGSTEVDYTKFGLVGHHGVDLQAEEGTPVYAPETGDVLVSQNGYKDPLSGAFVAGEVIVVRGIYDNWLLHLSKRNVSAGQRVAEGQLIGYSGDTGYTFGAHLHWGTRPLNPNMNNGYRGFINPKDALKGATMEKPQEGDAKNLYPVLYEQPANSGQIAYMTSKTWKDWAYGEIGGYYRSYVKPLREAAKQLPIEQAKVTQLTTTNKQLVETNKSLTTENAALKAQLAIQSDDTKLLNGFGEWLQKLIARLGVKKG